MVVNPRAFIEAADVGNGGTLESAQLPSDLKLDQLPAGVVSGTTLLDFSSVPSMAVRSGVSLSMLFASRVATKMMQAGDDEDDWLAAYTSSLGSLGFALAGSAIVKSRFKKTGLRVHQAIIPFLTVAFGGAAIGPVILAGLKNLQEMDKDAPWITLFDRETRRFSARELHFAAVSSSDSNTCIRYAIARLNVEVDEVSVLFLKLTDTEAEFESATTTMSANNGLLAVMEEDLRLKLGSMTRSYIAAATL
jgi:hypothetical protein